MIIVTYQFFWSLNTNLNSSCKIKNCGSDIGLQNNIKNQSIFNCYGSWYLEVFFGHWIQIWAKSCKLTNSEPNVALSNNQEKQNIFYFYDNSYFWVIEYKLKLKIHNYRSDITFKIKL